MLISFCLKNSADNTLRYVSYFFAGCVCGGGGGGGGVGAGSSHGQEATCMTCLEKYQIIAC